MSDFNLAIQTVLDHEGGYVNDPRDPGGETQFGISKRAYPERDIKHLTRDEAIEIYRRDWWDKYGYGEISDQLLATKVFDAAVNMGAKQTHTLLQRALVACGQMINEDGVLGEATFVAISQVASGWLLDRFRVELVNFYLNLYQRNKQRLVYLAGWIKRAIV